MQFKVPQFIDIEDKLFGPFTFKQFAYLVGGGGMAFVVYKLLPLWIGIFLIIPIVALTAALVFYKINNQPFIYYLQAGVNYFINSKLYIWKQRLENPDTKKNNEEDEIKTISVVPQVSSSRLKDISWGLDMKEETNDK